MKNSVLVVGLIAVLALALVYIGWAFSILWGWFVAPVFDLREISIPEAIGLSLTVGLLRARYRDTDLTKPEGKWSRLAFVAIAPAMFLLFGYITLQFV